VLSSAAVPTAALAEPDQATEGTAAPPGAGDPTADPDFDPGGPPTGLPTEATPLPPAPEQSAGDEDDSAPIEAEPVTEVAEPVVDAGDGGETAAQEPPPSEPRAPEGPPSAPTTLEQPTATATPAAPQNQGTSRSARPAGRDTYTERRVKKARRSVLQHAPRSAPKPSATDTGRSSVHEADFAVAPTPAPAPPSPPPAVTETPPATPASVTVAGPKGSRAAPGDRFYVVRPGESLWSIAADRLAGRATVARIAREVNRLWQLNRDRIATGDPNLLRVGTRLRLR